MRAAACLLVLAIPAVSGAAPRKAAAPTVISANNEPALRIAGTTLTRPFGAQLVDRLSVVGTYRLHDETAYLIKGEAGATCPARYLVASVKGRAAPVLSPAFGGCAPGATARVANGSLLITIPAAGAVPAARFTYANGVVQPQTALGLATIETLGCGSVRRSVDASTLAQVLDWTFSPYEARGAVVRRTEFADGDLRALVVDLSCLATLPEGDRRVPKRAADLFASKRHGDAAFAALDQVARMPVAGPDLRAAVRAFSANMRYYVGRRTVI